jgi:hypothetical protein
VTLHVSCFSPSELANYIGCDVIYIPILSKVRKTEIRHVNYNSYIIIKTNENATCSYPLTNRHSQSSNADFKAQSTCTLHKLQSIVVWRRPDDFFLNIWWHSRNLVEHTGIFCRSFLLEERLFQIILWTGSTRSAI